MAGKMKLIGEFAPDGSIVPVEPSGAPSPAATPETPGTAAKAIPDTPGTAAKTIPDTPLAAPEPEALTAADLRGAVRIGNVTDNGFIEPLSAEEEKNVIRQRHKRVLDTIDYSAPPEEVRKTLSGLPDDMRSLGYRRWGQYHVQSKLQEIETKKKEGVPLTAREQAFGKPNPLRGLWPFGYFFDEAGALADAGLPGQRSEAFEESLAKRRAETEYAETTYPVATLVNQGITGFLQGGIGSAVKGVGIVNKGARLARRAAGTAIDPLSAVTYIPGIGKLTKPWYGRVAGGAAAGAGLGAADTYLRYGRYGDELEDDSYTRSAGLGAALGAIVPTAIAASRGLARVIPASAYGAYIPGLGSAQSAAERVVLTNLERSGELPTMVGGGIAANTHRLSNFGPNSRMSVRIAPYDEPALLPVARMAAGEDPKALSILQDTARLRTDAYWDDTVEGFGRGLRIVSKDEAPKAVRKLKSDIRMNSAQYAAAYNAGKVPINDMLATINTIRNETSRSYVPGHPIRAKTEKILGLAVEAGPRGTIIKTGTLRQFDNSVMKTLNAELDAAEKAGDTALMAQLTNMKEKFTAMLVREKANSGYFAAKARHEELSRSLEAVNAGMAVLEIKLTDDFKQTLAEKVKFYKSLNADDRRFFRYGLYERFKHIVNSKRMDENLKSEKTRNLIKILDAIVPNSKPNKNRVYADRSRRLIDFLEVKDKQHELDRHILEGMPEPVEERAKHFGSQFFWLFRAGTRGVENGILFLQGAIGLRRDVAMELARRLAEQDPVRAAAWFRLLEKRRMRQNARREFTRTDRYIVARMLEPLFNIGTPSQPTTEPKEEPAP